MQTIRPKYEFLHAQVVYKICVQVSNILLQILPVLYLLFLLSLLLYICIWNWFIWCRFLSCMTVT